MTLSFGVAQCKNYLQNPQQQFPSFTNSSVLRAIRFSKKKNTSGYGTFWSSSDYGPIEAQLLVEREIF